VSNDDFQIRSDQAYITQPARQRDTDSQKIDSICFRPNEGRQDIALLMLLFLVLLFLPQTG